ncbi:copper resistance protein NlpE N-terminal domain-containing protein [Acinetobacter sp. Marseille-Q1618]|uniref:copper resistance protein NlpE N-terminal domain-containing protein n=1 Tax=Acinetobacter sp. Marseille-Q1618 TaxID=2697502 RepID=UPI00156F9C7A|nr:copper resistance protein NlpE N-terminal domain-containing protein [Acinetobacter sp. Marseille-Q1618]
MDKWVLFPFISTTVLFACSDSSNTEAFAQQDQEVKTLEQKQSNIAWVGHYQGVTPCENCLTRCEGCEGTAVDLTLKPDQSFELRLESLSEANTAQVLTGKMYFKDTAQSQLELSNIKKRHALIYDHDNDQFEILNDLTAQPYESGHEFILEKVV